MTKIQCLYVGDLHTESTHESGAKIATDAPKDNMGRGEAFSPTDLLAAGVLTCMLTLMGIASRKLGIDLKGTRGEVEKEMSTSGPRRVAKLVVRIRSALTPDAQAKERLERAALDCPVKHSLHPDIKLDVEFRWGA